MLKSEVHTVPTDCHSEPMFFARLEGRKMTADFGGELIASDAGALLLGATDRVINLVDRFAALAPCLISTRSPQRALASDNRSEFRSRLHIGERSKLEGASEGL